jgi:hypothetical protein
LKYSQILRKQRGERLKQLEGCKKQRALLKEKKGLVRKIETANYPTFIGRTALINAYNTDCAFKNPDNFEESPFQRQGNLTD